MTQGKRFAQAKQEEIMLGAIEYAILSDDDDEEGYLDYYLQINHDHYMSDWNEFIEKEDYYQ